jgi:hypothetical protein
MSVCTVCGQPRAATLGELPHLALEGQQRVVLSILCDVYPGGLTSVELVERMYKGTRDYGPDGAPSVLKAQIARLRRLLAPRGWTIPKGYRGRNHPGFYQLVRTGA